MWVKSKVGRRLCRAGGAALLLALLVTGGGTVAGYVLALTQRAERAEAAQRSGATRLAACRAKRRALTQLYLVRLNAAYVRAAECERQYWRAVQRPGRE
jgi:hypothetical protein